MDKFKASVMKGTVTGQNSFKIRVILTLNTKKSGGLFYIQQSCIHLHILMKNLTEEIRLFRKTGRSSSLAAFQRDIRRFIYSVRGGPLRESGSARCRSLPGVWPGPPDKEPRCITAKMEQQIP